MHVIYKQRFGWKLGVRHPQLFKAVAEHLVGGEDGSNNENIRGMGNFNPQGVGNMAWSYAKQAQLVNTNDDVVQAYTKKNTGRLAVYETSCRDVGERTINRFFTAIAEAVLSNGRFPLSLS
jgi:hypothetical protein